MALHGSYDPDNIFAKILRGDIPSIPVFDDPVALAFMDLFPQSRGHTLVIPKGVTARNFLDLDPDKVGEYMQRVQIVAKAVEKALSPDGIVLTQFNGAPAGQTVFHLHFHIIPRYENVALKGHAQAGQADPEDLKTIAAEIRAAL